MPTPAKNPMVAPAAPTRTERAARYLAPASALLFAFLVLGKGAAAISPSLSFLSLPAQLYFELSIVLILLQLVGHFLARRLAKRSLNRARRADYRLCTRCHYTLDGLGDTCDCPECGTRFDVEDAKTAWELRVLTHPKPMYRE